MSVLESTYGSTPQCVNVPKDIVEDLILASRKAIIQDTHGLFFCNGCYALPTLLIHQMLEVVETCIEGIPFVPNDEANSQAQRTRKYGWHSGKECAASAQKSTFTMDLF